MMISSQLRPNGEDPGFRYYAQVIAEFGSDPEWHFSAESLYDYRPRFHCYHWPGFSLVEDMQQKLNHWIFESEGMRLWAMLNQPPEATITHG